MRDHPIPGPYPKATTVGRPPRGSPLPGGCLQSRTAVVYRQPRGIAVRPPGVSSDAPGRSGVPKASRAILVAESSHRVKAQCPRPPGRLQSRGGSYRPAWLGTSVVPLRVPAPPSRPGRRGRASVAVLGLLGLVRCALLGGQAPRSSAIGPRIRSGGLSPEPPRPAGHKSIRDFDLLHRRSRPTPRDSRCRPATGHRYRLLHSSGTSSTMLMRPMARAMPWL